MTQQVKLFPFYRFHVKLPLVYDDQSIAASYNISLRLILEHFQKSRTSNFVRITFRLFRNRFFLLVFAVIPGLIMFGKFEWSNTYLFMVNKSSWSKILPKPKMVEKILRNKLSNERFWCQFRWILADILQSDGLGFFVHWKSVFFLPTFENLETILFAKAILLHAVEFFSCFYFHSGKLEIWR